MNVNVIKICYFSVSPQFMALLCSETSWPNGYSKFCKSLSETSFTNTYNTWKLDQRILNRTVKCEDSDSRNEVRAQGSKNGNHTWPFDGILRDRKGYKQ